MDLYAKLHAINNSPENVRARQERRARRREQVHARISDAIGQTRSIDAALQWALYSTDPSEDPGTPVGSQHPGQVAVIAVRQALAEFNLPTQFEARWVGTQRFAGRGPHHVTDGIITVEVGLHSMSGVDRYLDVPVIVREGRVLEPACVIDRGEIRAMTQSTFDDLFEQGTFLTQVPTRRTMYSPPPEDRRTPQEVPLVRPGMFGTSPINKQLTAAYVKSAMQGHYVDDMMSFEAMRDAAPDHLDRAEQPPASLAGGDDVTLSRAVNVVGRDGQRWHLEKGTKGQVQRDMAGDDRYYYVFFPDLGFSAKIGADALR